MPVCHIHWVDATGSHAWQFKGDQARAQADAMRASLMDDPGTALIVVWGLEGGRLVVSKIGRREDGLWRDAACTPTELEFIRTHSSCV